MIYEPIVKVAGHVCFAVWLHFAQISCVVDMFCIDAQSLFDKVNEMDGSSASAFYNALTNMLRCSGTLVRKDHTDIVKAKSRQVWENVWSKSCLNLHIMFSGAACQMVHVWLLNIRSIVCEGSILTGWGKHIKMVGDGALRPAVEALLRGIDAPFYLSKYNMGWFTSSGSVGATWLRESATLQTLNRP
ncbi:hypothetical protein Bca52824_043422 [Brassica carinata]|uniref:Smr domain-containing protein n=1 Tax=Brassica carinata TaxID=52824 RepID=A0A8X7RWI2_BRACI|nr:hypothetical protein Bca52824_043422 [Brassica carinata]